MSKELLSRFSVFGHVLQNKHMTKNISLTLIGSLVQKLDNITNNETPCKKLDSYYYLVEHIIKSDYITYQDAVSIYNDTVLKFEK